MQTEKKPKVGLHRFHMKIINGNNRVNRSRWGTALLVLFPLGLGILMALPMVLMISNAFKPRDELFIFPPRLFPSKPTLGNFREMFIVMSSSYVPFMRYIFNSLFVTAVGSGGHIIISSMCAYPLAKKQFPGRNIIFRIIVLSLMFSATAATISNYLIISYLGWIDTYMALIVPAFGAPIGLYLMKQFMEQIPDSLLEAARIDGASQWYTFWKIVMPNVRSAWLTLLLLSVQNLWGLGDNVFIYKEEMKTLPYALGQILAGGIARTNVGAAVSACMMIVPVAIFIVSQSNIIETMASSGLKD